MTGTAIFFMIFGFAFLIGGLLWTMNNMIQHHKNRPS